MKILYINTFSKGSHHEIYNAALLKICSLCADKVLAVSDKNTLSNYQKILKDELINVTPRFITSFSQNSKRTLVLAYLWGAVMNIILLLFSPSKYTYVYVFNNSFSSCILNLINRVLKRNVIICCHGELELLLNATVKRGALATLLGYNIRHFFEMDSSTLKLIVMGESISNNLLRICNSSQMRLFLLDHPYIFTKAVRTKRSISSIIRVGTIGTLSVSKGLYQYLDLIEYVHARSASSKLQFSIIGKVDYSHIDIFKSYHVAVPIGNGKGDRDVYDNYIETLDYILFFYPVDSYRLTASGAIYDAIAHAKPILSLKNDYFQYLFEKYGSFGLLFDDIEQMGDFLINGEMPAFDFDSFADKISPEYLARDFDRILRS